MKIILLLTSFLAITIVPLYGMGTPTKQIILNHCKILKKMDSLEKDKTIDSHALAISLNFNINPTTGIITEISNYLENIPDDIKKEHQIPQHEKQYNLKKAKAYESTTGNINLDAPVIYPNTGPLICKNKLNVYVAFKEKNTIDKEKSNFTLVNTILCKKII